MKNVRLLHVCLVTLLSPIALSLVSLGAQAQRGQFVGGSQKSRPGLPFTDIHASLPKNVVRKTVKNPTRNAAVPQTVDLTAKTASVDDRHPYWPKSQNAQSELPLVFDSNRSLLDGSKAGTLYHVYMMQADGSNVVALTGPLSTLATGKTEQQTEPAMNGNLSSVVYVNTPTSGLVDLFELNVNTGISRSLLGANPNFKFSAVTHPEYGIVPGGNIGVIFSGTATTIPGGTPVPGGNHLYAVDTQSGLVAQLTGGACDDENPTLSPDPSKPVIAFDSDRADTNGASTKANRDIWTIDAAHPMTAAHQVTGFSAGGTAADNIQPAWSTNKIDQPTGSQQIVNGQQLIAFATTRQDSKNDGNADGINSARLHDIYWLKVNVGADPNGGLNTALNPTDPTLPVEDPSNVAFKLTTSDPGHQFDDTHPTFPQFITSYRVTYQTNRSAYDPGSGLSVGPTVTNDIFSSTLMDLNAPTIVRFDEQTGDVVGVTPRLATPGSKVTISVKLQDLETGIKSVWVQIKNPNSKYQSLDGIEHKVYTFAGLEPDATNVVLNVPVEYDSEPIFIGPKDANGNPTDPRFNTYPRPKNAALARAPSYTSGIDDFFAFSGMAHPPDKPDPKDPSRDTGWMQMKFASRDAATGVTTYSADWQTPNVPSDYYIDIIAYDNALNPFTTGPGDVGSNWIIYDNVFGFTTQSFNAAHGVLFVSDYAAGQKFFNSRFGVNTLVNTYNTFWGTESWLTDYDVKLLPTRYVPVTGGTGGVVVGILDTLGVNSYVDFYNTDGTVTDGFPVPATQQYDLWRIMSRGPVPDSVLAQYTPHMEQQPPDAISGEKTNRTVLVAPRCVVWLAPFAGDLFVGPGDIADLAVQNQLHSFLASGGRLFMNGQDIAWALTLSGGISNSFVANDLKANFVTDAEPNTLYRIPVGSFALLYLLSLDNSYQMAGKPAYDPITHDPWGLTGPVRVAQVHHEYFGPPIPPGDIDWVDRDPNFISGGTLPPGPPTVRDYASPAVAFPDNITAASGAVVDMTYANGNAGIIRSQDDVANSKVVFCSFGLEGLNQDAFSAGTNIIQLKNRQAEVMHNVLCWLRTGSIVGSVVDTDSGVPLADVLVRLDNMNTATGTGIVYAYTAISTSSGAFQFNGVNPGTYEITAAKPGFVIQKGTFVTTHGGYRDQTAFKMTKAEPASITGKVTETDGKTPVVGATVTATDVLKPFATFTGVTDSNGKYVIDRVPSETVYTLTVTAPGYGTSIPASYSVPNPNDPIPSQRDVLVQPAKTYIGFDFKLNSSPGIATGKVVDAATSAGIGGAVVTATRGSVSQTATTDGAGNYTFAALSAGTWSFVAAAAGYAPNTPVTATVQPNVSVTVPTISLTSLPPGSISGLVTRTSDSSALAGVTITVTDPAGTVRGTATTGASQTVNGYTFNYVVSSVPAGVTYTVTATDPGYTATPVSQSAAVSGGTETKNINFQMSPLHTFPGALSMVSAPYDYTGSDVATLLGIPTADRTNGAFEFATWTVGGYAFYPQLPANTFQLGRGYFMAYRNNLALATQGTPANVTAPFDISLDRGWNMIGDPFTFSIDWTKVHVTANGATVPHDTAVQQGLIGPALFTYAAGGYVLDYTIAPWQGYWVHAFQPVVLHIDPTTDQAGRSAVVSTIGLTRAALTANNSGGWAMNLRLDAGDVRDTDNYIGVHSGATDGADGYKAEKPPLFGSRYAQLSVMHNDWGSRNGMYGIDLRSSSPSSKVWLVDAVTTAKNVTARLSWPGVAAVGRKVDLTLTDLDSGQVQDLRSTSVYSWQTGGAVTTRHFQITATPAALNGHLVVTGLVARSAGGRAGSTAGSVVVSYSLSASANVDIRIIAPSGKQVRRVSLASGRAAGVNEAVWDLKTDGGVSVPAGAYIVELHAQSVSGGQSTRAVTPVLVVR